MARTFLITGASGFLGKVIQKWLLGQGHDTLALSRELSGRFNINIASPFNFDKHERFDSVIHAAGKAHSVPQTEEEKQAFYDVNFEGTKNLCRALGALEQVPKSFIFISTVAVYGVDAGEMIGENEPLNGSTPYADSKLLAEEWLQHWANERGITLGILRLPLIAGPNPPGNLGAMICGIESGKYLSIGQANARKSMVWAEDIARIIPALAESGGTYNLTDGHHPTFGELEAGISKALGKGQPLKVPYWVAKCLAKTGDIVGRRFPINSDKLQKITSTLTFDDTKARSDLGWDPIPVLSKVDEFVMPL